MGEWLDIVVLGRTLGGWGVLLGAAALVATVVILIVWVFERAWLYYPDPTRTDPATLNLPRMRDLQLYTEDGHRLVVWWAPPEPGKPTILYMHGNRRGLARRAKFFRRFLDAGYGLVAPSFRGFGGSTGRPGERNIVSDAQQVYDTLRAVGVPSDNIIAYGESLGTGTAVQLAASRDVGGVILQAPYDAIENVASWRMPFLLPRRLMRDRYRSIDHIHEVSAPILWLHGTDDGVIPMRFGQNLFDKATAPKVEGIVDGAGHFGLYNRHVFRIHIQPFIDGREAVKAGTYDGARRSGPHPRSQEDRGGPLPTSGPMSGPASAPRNDDETR